MDVAQLAYKIDSSQAVTASRNLDQMAASARKTETATERMDRRMAVLQKSLAAIAVAVAAFNTLKGVLNVTAQFQKLNAQLVTVTGSQKAANIEFKKLQEFAARTPYQLSEVVNAFVKMKALGLDPSQRALASYGNTAAAMGKTLNQFIEAVADASTSEFERLKEFGIKARQEGDKVTLTFQGLSTTIGNNAQEITRYLRDIGENQFAGAMERQANTLDGAWSNLADSTAVLANAIGTILSPAVISITRSLAEATAETAGFVEYIGKLLTFDVSALEETEKEIERTTQLVDDLRKHIALLKADDKTGRGQQAAIKKLNEELKVAEFAAEEARKAQEKLLNVIEEVGEESDNTAPAVAGLGNAFKKAEEEARKYLESLIRQREMLGLSEEETIGYEAAQEAAKAPTKELGEEILKQAKALQDATKRAQEYEAALKAWERQQGEHNAILMDGEEAIRRLNEMNSQFSAILGGPVARAYQQHKQDLADIARLEFQLRESGNLTQQQIQNLADARTAATELYKRELADIAYESDRAAQEVDRAWDQASQSIADAIGDAATGGIESFEDFADTVKDIARRLVSELISTFAQNLFSGQSGNFGSLFGGGAGGGGGGFLGSLVSGIGSFFGLGGATGITAAAGTATGVTGTAAAAGFTGGANAAASSGGFGSLFGGSGSGFAGIPVVGWILAGMAINNSLFGSGWGPQGGSTTLPNGATVSGGGGTQGRIADRLFDPLGILGDRFASLLSGSATINRLFGRKAPRLTDGETTFGFGPDGISGTERYRTLEEGGVFRSDRRRWHDFGLSEDSEAYAQEIFDSLGATIRNASAQLGSDAEVNFQAAMRVVQKFNKKGEVESTQLFVDVLGRSFEAATEEEALTRLGAEATIAAIDASMGGVADAMGQGIVDAAERGGASGGAELGEIILRDLKSAGPGIADAMFEGVRSVAERGEASAIAERWRNDAYKLAEGAQFLLSAAADINAGYALLGDDSSLTQITDLTEELSHEGETLLATYERMVISTRLFGDALELSGIELDKTREEIVRFAVDIAEAAGGLERASELWSIYFNEFFSEQELAQQRLDRANQARNAALEAIGLDSGISNADFRAQFEELLPTLTPEEVHQWLLASEAIAAANAAQAAYNNTLTETAQVAPEALNAIQDHLAGLRAARDEYASFAASLRREFSRIGLSEFQTEMRNIAEWTKENIRTLNDLARAAGYAAASESDLALVHEIAAARAAEAIARLTNSARSLVEQLYGSGDAGATLIDNTQGFIDTALGGIGEISAATNDLYQSQLAAIQNIQAYLDAQLLSDTSSLTPFERLNEARRQFEEMFQRALTGDVDALNDIPGLADILLRLGREYDPSDYPELEAWVRGLLQQLTAIAPQEPPTGTGTDPTVGGGFGPGGQIGDVTGAINDGTQTISDERAALVAELFEMVRDLMDATGQSLSEVAASIGLNVQDFIRDLGVNLDELTVETTMQLATIASRLGVSLEELAGQVGVDLGNLADAQSLLNQALGETIAGLPEEDRRALQPLFQQIAAATTATDANAAIAALTQAAQAIGGDTALALQPFLNGINIVAPIETSNALLGTLTMQGADQLLELQNIVNELRGTGQGPGLPGTGGGGSGGGGLPGTGGIPGPTAQGTSQQVTSLLEGIVSRLDRVEAATTNAGAMTVDAISGDQAKRVRAAEAAKDAALTNRRA